MRPYGDPRRQYTGEYADPVPRQGSRTETPMESSIAAVSLSCGAKASKLDIVTCSVLTSACEPRVGAIHSRHQVCYRHLLCTALHLRATQRVSCKIFRG